MHLPASCLFATPPLPPNYQSPFSRHHLSYNTIGYLLLRRAGAHLEGISVVLLHQEHWGPRDIRQVPPPGRKTALSVLAVATHVDIDVDVSAAVVVVVAVRGDRRTAVVVLSGGMTTTMTANSDVDVLSLDDVVQGKESHLLYTHARTHTTLLDRTVLGYVLRRRRPVKL